MGTGRLCVSPYSGSSPSYLTNPRIPPTNDWSLCRSDQGPHVLGEKCGRDRTKPPKAKCQGYAGQERDGDVWDPTDVTKPGTLPCTDLGPSPSHPTPHFPWSLEGKYAQAHYLLSKHGGPGPGCRSSPSIPPHLPTFFWGAIPFLILRVSPRLQLGPRFSPSTKPWLPHRDQSPSFRGAPHKQVNPITVREPPRTATGAGIRVVLLMMGRMGTSVYIQGPSLP